MSGIDLANMPLEEVAKLREQADQEIRDRRCLAWLRNGPSCQKENGHDGPHEGITYAIPPDGGMEVRCLLSWHLEQ